MNHHFMKFEQKQLKKSYLEHLNAYKKTNI